jgi:hypothetical protein
MLRLPPMATRTSFLDTCVRRSPTWGVAGLVAGLTAAACANEAPRTVSDNEQSRTYLAVAVDRSDPAAAEAATGSASAIARFVSIPAESDSARVLVAAGTSLDLPAPDACATSGSQDGLEPPLPSQGPVEFLEAGDVAIVASGATTPLVPHAFPTVGAFASGVLYTTRDRAASALPQGVPYVVTASGSPSVANVHVETDAPPALTSVELLGTAIKDVTDVRTGSPLTLAWNPGEAPDTVYVELLAYDGSSSIVCTFHDELGSGTVPADAFNGVGPGRIAIHRVRQHRIDAGPQPNGEIRFDFQIGSAVEFAR